VCTTELGYMAKLRPEFDKRNVKIIGLSVDATGDHEKWADDLEETQGARPNYPLIGDADFEVSKAYGMLPAETTGDAKSRSTAPRTGGACARRPPPPWPPPQRWSRPRPPAASPPPPRPQRRSAAGCRPPRTCRPPGPTPCTPTATRRTATRGAVRSTRARRSP